MKYKNRMKDIFDMMEEPDENYAERFAEELRQEFLGYKATAQNKIATGMQIAARLFITGTLLFISACALIVASCIKFLFFI